MWIDGAQQSTLANLDNDTRRVDEARLGPSNGIDTYTRGTEHFDDFESRRSTYIGPVVPSSVASVIRKSYYRAGSQLIAMRVEGDPVVSNNGLFFLHSDHLGSASLTTNASGTAIARQMYDAWGNIRAGASTGKMPTDIGYTGQRLDASTGGLMFYGARYYAPYLNRWLSPDTIVPNPKNPQSLNRYSYTYNNPVKYTDPTGHDVDCGLGESGCKKQPKKPPIVSRSKWEAMPPGYVYCMADFCSIAGTEEGFYEPGTPDNGGYAKYSDLLPGQTLADILDIIVIHHEGDYQDYSVQRIQQQHMYNKQYTDIAYHFAIAPDGTIYEGRDIEVRGAHVYQGNTKRIGILLLGDFNPNNDFYRGDDMGPTKAQMGSALALTRWLDARYGIKEVVGHREVPLNDTECPGELCMPFVRRLNGVVQEQ